MLIPGRNSRCWLPPHRPGRALIGASVRIGESRFVLKCASPVPVQITLRSFEFNGLIASTSNEGLQNGTAAHPFELLIAEFFAVRSLRATLILSDVSQPSFRVIAKSETNISYVVAGAWTESGFCLNLFEKGRQLGRGWRRVLSGEGSNLEATHYSVPTLTASGSQRLRRCIERSPE